MEPAGNHFRRKCDEAFVIGTLYPMTVYEDRSDKTHKHAFAWVREAWSSLPDNLLEVCPTPEHLRKRALVECGFFDETMIDAGTTGAALRVAAAWKARDTFAHIVVRKKFVVIRTAKSQSRRAMDAKEFQDSKQAILEHIAALINVEPAELERAGRPSSMKED
jgi:hypothetical protein